VTAKFVKFQRPADFDGKLAHVKHLLEDIEERLSCLEIASSEPDDIQNQLDQCMVPTTLLNIFYLRRLTVYRVAQKNGATLLYSF